MFEKTIFISNALDKDTSIKWVLINGGFSVVNGKNSGKEEKTMLAHIMHTKSVALIEEAHQTQDCKNEKLVQINREGSMKRNSNTGKYWKLLPI